jgi:hypothetical protein
MDPKALVSSLGSVDEERLLRALHRIKDELLDIDYFAPGEFVNGEAWVAMDRDYCTIAMSTDFFGVLFLLGGSPGLGALPK